MPDRVLASRYAEALLGVVADPESLEEINAELRAVADLVRDDARLKAFLEGPNVVEDHKHDLVRKVFEGRVQPLLLDFLRLLIDKHRIDHLAPIAESFQQLVEEKRNQVRTQVTTAVPLSEDAADRLKRTLDAATGRDTILEHRIEPSILGGIVVVFGDQVIDGSVRTALEGLRKELMGAAL